jgi:hypothetical protein
VDQVHLAQVRLRRLPPGTRAVLHGGTGVDVTLHAEALEKADGPLRLLLQPVDGAAVHGFDPGVHRPSVATPLGGDQRITSEAPAEDAQQAGLLVGALGRLDRRPEGARGVEDVAEGG